MLELSHKKLIAWQKAIVMLPLVYGVCQKLPKEELFNLVSQMKRAALSVSNNLAEGSSRKTKAEKNRFSEISRSSVVEIDNSLTACLELKFLTQEDISLLTGALLEEFKLITGLIESNNR
jgi:four helix bundle protein